MLIESDELEQRIKSMMKDARESLMVFSHYKLVIECLDNVRDIIRDIEVSTAFRNAQHKYASALEELSRK